MKRLVLCLVSVSLVSAVGALAQMGGGGQAAPMKISLAMGIQRSYDGVKRNLIEMADKVSEENYKFQPTPDIRTFGMGIGHVANAQFGSCAAAQGVPNPNMGNDNEKKTTKAEFVKALADSFALCDKAYAALTDANAGELVKQGNNEVARGSILANTNAHSNEMYGTLAVYMRLKGMVPPSTERQPAMRR